MCAHSNKTRKTKILKLAGDRYQQILEFCMNCKFQTEVRLTALKEGNHRGHN